MPDVNVENKLLGVVNKVLVQFPLCDVFVQMTYTVCLFSFRPVDVSDPPNLLSDKEADPVVSPMRQLNTEPFQKVVQRLLSRTQSNPVLRYVKSSNVSVMFCSMNNTDHVKLTHVHSITLLGPVDKFWCSAWLGKPRAGPALWNYLAPPYSRHIEGQCVTCITYLWILIISIHTSRFGIG